MKTGGDWRHCTRSYTAMSLLTYFVLSNPVTSFVSWVPENPRVRMDSSTGQVLKELSYTSGMNAAYKRAQS
jgi:hypothetical protein